MLNNSFISLRKVNCVINYNLIFEETFLCSHFAVSLPIKLSLFVIYLPIVNIIFDLSTLGIIQILV